MAKNRNVRKSKKSAEASSAKPLKDIFGPDRHWTCPYLVAGCRSWWDHDEHPGALKLIEDPETSVWQAALIARAAYHPRTFNPLPALLAREDFAKVLPHLIRNAELAREAPFADVVFNALVEKGISSKNLLKRLSFFKLSSPEAVILFISNPAVYDQLAVNLLKANLSSPAWPELREAFACGSEVVRAALALSGLPCSRNWSSEQLFHASRAILNDMNRDRAAALATIESMALSWESSFEDFRVMVAQLT